MGKNRSRSGKGYLPRLMTTFANLAMRILRLLRIRNIRRGMGPLNMRPHGAVARLTG